MDPIIVILGLVTSLLGIAANALVAILFWRLKRMDQDIELFKRELSKIQLNYLNRFDALKEHQNAMHTDIAERLTKLEVLIKKNNGDMKQWQTK